MSLVSLLFLALGIVAGVGAGWWLYARQDCSAELRQQLGAQQAEFAKLRSLFDERGRAIAKLTEELDLARTGATAVGTEWTGRYKKLEAELNPTRMQLVELRADKERLSAQLTECRRQLTLARSGEHPGLKAPGAGPG
jgi:chromosome segregation ATPase